MTVSQSQPVSTLHGVVGETVLSAPVQAVNGYAPPLYVDGLAERLKARAGEPYQPSNGSEGQMFMGMWCARCKADAAFRADMNSADGCEIIANTMAMSARDPDYPREWQYSTDGQPICRAFQPKDTPDRPPQIPGGEQS